MLPSTPHHQEYSARYIQKALNREQIESPDISKAGMNGEILQSIYDAFQLGGNESVQTAWSTIKRLQPTVAHLETWQSKFINANELHYLSAPNYLIPEYPIYEKGFNLIFGASNAGKSFFALDIAGKTAQTHPVIYVAGEGLHGFANRWHCWKTYHKKETDKLIFYTEALQITNDLEVSQFIESLQETKPALVIIDTLARSAIGIEENSAKEIGSFIQKCDAIRTQLNCAIMLIHHTGKSGKMRGSSALYAAADSVLALSNEDNVITVRNDFEGDGKNKYNAPEPRKYFQIIPYDTGDIEGAVIVEQDQAFTNNQAEKLTSNQYSILEALLEINEPISTQTLIEVSEVSKSSVYRNIKHLEELNYITTNNGIHSITEQGTVSLNLS